MTSQAQPKCEFCDKYDLPVLPTRFSVAPAEAGMPQAKPDDFGKAFGAINSHYHYTQRLLRSGYLYVYDEARKRWEGYLVTNGAYFMRFEVGKPVPQSYTAGRQPCDRAGHKEVAGMVTIRDSKNATKVWFGFSDVEWTTDTLKQHENAAYRAKHMQVLDVKKALAKATQPNVQPIKELAKQVAEYAIEHDMASWYDNALSPSAQAAGQLGHCSFAFNWRKDRAQQTIEAADSLRKGAGVILTLYDPVAVARELAVAMQYRLDAFTHAPQRRRQVYVSSSILVTKEAIRNQAELSEMDAAEKLADGMIYDPIDPAMPQSGNNAWRYARDPAFRKRVEDVRTTTPAELLHAADTAWSKYTAKYDENARDQWQVQYDKALKQLDSEHIAPLAVAHATWMRSQRIANYYACNYDPADAESGAVYTRTVALCIEGTQDKKACFDLYEQWFGGDLTDRKNLILRALLFNLDQQAEQIKQAAKPNMPLETQPWDDMIGSFGNAVEKVKHNEADTLGRLITGISGIVGKFMRAATEGPVKQGLIALSVVSRQPLVQVEITGSKKAFRALLIRQMLNAYDQRISPNQIQRAVSAELRRLQINGVKMDGTEKKKFLLLVDPEHIKRMPQGLAPSARAQWLARSVRTVEQFEEALGINRWRKLMERGSAIGRTSTPFVIGAAMMVANWTAIGKLTEDAANSMNHNATEAKNRLWAGYLAFGGTAAEVSGAALGGIAGRFGKARHMGLLSRTFSIAGRFLGIVGAGIMAVWDAKNAKDSFQQGNTGMGIAYLASATFGFVAALLIAFGATGIGLLLIGIVIAIAVLIEIYKDNKLQEWLKRCYWGKLSSERYPGHLTERQQFELALKG